MGLFSKSTPNAGAAGPAVITPSPSPSPSAAIPPAVAISPVQAAPRIAVHHPPAVQSERSAYLQHLKVRIHQQLVARLDVQNLKSLPPDTVRDEVRVVPPMPEDVLMRVDEHPGKW